MKKLILATLLIVASTSAMAEWTLVNSDDNYDSYVNRTSIRKVGDKAKMWVMTNHKVAQKAGDSQFLSDTNLMEYNCKSEQDRMLAATGYPNSMGEGQSIFSYDYDNSKFTAIRPDSVAELKWKIACGKK